LKDQQQKIRDKLKDLKKRKNRYRKQREYYSGKKKKHTIKTQIVINKKTKKIICTNFTNGKTHDFKLFKDSNLPFQEKQTILVDSGYTGIIKYFKEQNNNLNNQNNLSNLNILIPKKKTKNNPLTEQDKINNHEISKQRIVVENVIGEIKVFRILSDKYRCRRKRFGLRFNLVCGIRNYER
jgi:hypothetical protein